MPRAFQKDELPPALAKRLPHYPVPAAVLGRLAVDRKHQGRGLGEMLLLDAVRRSIRASATIAIHAIIVDAKNDPALSVLQALRLWRLRQRATPLFSSLSKPSRSSGSNPRRHAKIAPPLKRPANNAAARLYKIQAVKDAIPMPIA